MKICTSLRVSSDCGALLAETIRQDRVSEKVVAAGHTIYTSRHPSHTTTFPTHPALTLRSPPQSSTLYCLHRQYALTTPTDLLNRRLYSAQHVLFTTHYIQSDSLHYSVLHCFHSPPAIKRYTLLTPRSFVFIGSWAGPGQPRPGTCRTGTSSWRR